MDLQRLLYNTIYQKIGQQKVIIIYGTRRVGKTILMEQIANAYPNSSISFNAEDGDDVAKLAKRTIANYKALIGDKKIVLIDEAQQIPEVGKVLKLMIDGVKGITIIASGSSSFDLINKAGEPLVGRSYSYQLFPIAQCELKEDMLTAYRQLEERLVYGSYPELWHLPNLADKENYLRNLVQGYLLKDIFQFKDVRNADKVFQLLKLLAYQAGSEVSLNELANTLGINKLTVEHYLDLLTKVFVIYSLSGYGGNLRKEVVKTKKWYFYDNGIRNAIINDFKPIQNRNDVGILWEQYVLSERQKRNAYNHYQPSYFFWRTYDQQEVDFIEANGDEIAAIECKWGNAKRKVPTAFAKTYANVPFTFIDKDNYFSYIH